MQRAGEKRRRPPFEFRLVERQPDTLRIADGKAPQFQPLRPCPADPGNLDPGSVLIDRVEGIAEQHLTQCRQLQRDERYRDKREQRRDRSDEDCADGPDEAGGVAKIGRLRARHQKACPSEK